jgi:integrase
MAKHPQTLFTLSDLHDCLDGFYDADELAWLAPMLTWKYTTYRLKRRKGFIEALLNGSAHMEAELRARDPVSEFVFSGRWGKRMSRSNVNRMLTDAGQRAGLPNVTPHSLRHACGYELAMRGTDTRRLQIYLGHRSIQSTVVYTDLAMHATDSLGM